MPARIEDKLGLAAFFTNHANYEQPNLGVTKAQAILWRTNTLTTQEAYAAAQVAQKTASDARDTAYEVVAGNIRKVIKNLSEILDPMDPRWLDFGLNQPGADMTPSQPINLTAGINPMTGDIMVNCDPVALATRYRYRMLLVGVETDYSLAASSLVPMASISGVEPGQTAKIIVQAVNGSAQSVPSDPVEVTIPVAQAAAKAMATAPAAPSLSSTIEQAIVAASNGSSSNGHSLLTTVGARS